MGSDELALLSAIADNRVKQCGGDLAAALATLRLLAPTRAGLEQLADGDLNDSLAAAAGPQAPLRRRRRNRFVAAGQCG